jgi:hypothetical protein
MSLGLVGGVGQIDTASVACVLFFPVAPAGYGTLATSYSRRHPQRKGLASSVCSASSKTAVSTYGLDFYIAT